VDAVPAAVADRSREVTVEIDGDGAGKVSGRVQLGRRRTAEPPPHVEQDKPRRRHVPHGSIELTGIDQGIASVHHVILADAACTSPTRLLGVVPFE
jgi:hypothetical protein